MGSIAETTTAERYDARSVVIGGVKLGLITAAGVLVFAFLSRIASGTLETIVQSLLVLAGAALFSYLPAAWVQPRTPDGVGWTALVGLLGSLVFTVVDTVLLRPLGTYHWTWDAIGGGSGFWYVPVWWMGSATLAWFAGMVVMYRSFGGGEVGWVSQAAITLGGALVLFIAMTLVGVTSFHPAAAALAWSVALLLHIPIAAKMYSR